ncbi:uncharacterized protein LOC131328847 [Rhododendron vialii]|uniref:uncharacterized protein LOC131328847 n=1 Tax=Rhododendron vialii TaxID=182163 RepID=UPI00265F1B5F|nr:uncharacterized protein LOC131328847 [Rhododendron vialii]XP_058217787.1 uncharacterized protein LOC131328847 [Rhododendron vialii]
MDKSWMTIRRNRLASREYILGVESFLQFAMANLGPQPEIRCPCNDCLNGRKHSFAVKIHLIRKGFDSSYKTWVHHGEFVPTPQAYDDDHHHPNEGIGDETGGEVPKDGNPLQNMLEQVFVGGLLDDDSDELPANLGRGNVRSFDKLFNAAQRKIYPGCEKTVLAFIVELLHVKVYKKMPNDTFHIMMNIIKGMRSDYDEAIPWNTYEAKKFLRDLGLGYVPIHACINDCALFWKENANMENCPKCNEPRYKVNDDCIMPPGSKKSSASSNSTSTMRNTAAVRVETEALTPASEILTSTPLTVSSPSTHASASGAPSAKRWCVRGPTRGKRIRRIIVENKGERISAYVMPEMRAFCGINANKVASELGTQIRWICPIQGFYASWNDGSDDLKRAVLQAVRVRMSNLNGYQHNTLII